MSLRNDIALFEYAYLVSEESGITPIPHEIEAISPLAFLYLKGIALGRGQDNRLFRLCKKLGVEALQAQHYAGVIFTPDGTQIEILPKLGRPVQANNTALPSPAARCEEARQALLIMLRALREFSHLQTTNANIRQQKMPLLEVFISQFLDSVNTLVKKGLRSDYVRCEENLSYLKGKLNTARQLRQNIITKHKFHCEYDEFLVDRPANRLLHSALVALAAITRSGHNQRLLQELTFIFCEVPLSADYKSDFARLRIDRGMSHYQTPLAWAKLILEGFSPQTMSGGLRAISLLFPMERVFENYVAKMLRATLPPQLTLTAQAQRKHLVSHHDAAWFRLKPDMVIEQDSKVICVLDTKWKLLDPAKGNGTDKYDLQQGDFYQMFAYGHHYFDDPDGDREMFLVYPAHRTFQEPIAQPFDFPVAGQKTMRLWVVPFVIDAVASRLVLPTQCQLQQRDWPRGI
ncbi:MAG: McrC family protein [Aeromonas sp.]